MTQQYLKERLTEIYKIWKKTCGTFTHPEVALQFDPRRTKSEFIEGTDQIDMYFEPPKETPVKTIFSEVYQRDVPKKLYDAGLEELDKKTGERVIEMNALIRYKEEIEAKSKEIRYETCRRSNYADRIIYLGEAIAILYDTQMSRAHYKFGQGKFNNQILDIMNEARSCSWHAVDRAKSSQKGFYDPRTGIDNIEDLAREHDKDPLSIFCEYYGASPKDLGIHTSLDK